MLLCKCKAYRYCRTHPKCTAIHQTLAAPRSPDTLPRFPGVDGSGALWGTAALTPQRGRGCSKGAVKIIEPFGRSHLWPPWQAQLLDVVGWVFFSPPELPCDRVNPRGIEGSVPVRTGASHRARSQGGRLGAGIPQPAHSCVSPESLWRRDSFPEDTAILQSAGTCVPGADMPRPLDQALALGRALFRGAIMGRELMRH